MSALHVLFQVGTTDYVVPVEDVLQLDSFSSATKVPGTPAHVAGVVHLRSAVVPVVDLRARFSLPAQAPTLDSRIVVVRHEGRAVGLLADKAREVVRLSDEGGAPPPDLTKNESGGCVRAVSRVGDRWALHLDIGRVVGPESIDGQ